MPMSGAKWPSLGVTTLHMVMMLQSLARLQRQIRQLLQWVATRDGACLEWKHQMRHGVIHTRFLCVMRTNASGAGAVK